MGFFSLMGLFYVLQVPGMSLVPLYEKLCLKNVSTLALSLELTLAEPFGLCDCTSDDSFTSSKVHKRTQKEFFGMGWQKTSERMEWDIIRKAYFCMYLNSIWICAHFRTKALMWSDADSGQ